MLFASVIIVYDLIFLKKETENLLLVKNICGKINHWFHSGAQSPLLK
jgi:hypothetical protein